MNMKRMATIAMVVCLAISMVGCDAVQRKFTRKKKAEKKKPKIYQVKKYEKKPTPELYNKHYVYWETWSSELIELIGQNQKKDRRCIEEIVGQLTDMQNILNEEKAEEFQPHIDTAIELRDIIHRGDMSFSVKNYVKSMLEREDRAIKRNFITSKVKNSLKESFDDESAPQLAVGQEPQETDAGEK